MEGEFMSKKNRLPEIIVFAGPNGSGKTTITRMARTIGVYINADDIKRSSLCSDLEAAVKAEELREEMLEKGEDFTFETVLSTDRNLKLLKKAKEKGYFLRCIYF
jgi:predicted ABC-type ATPase